MLSLAHLNITTTTRWTCPLLLPCRYLPDMRLLQIRLWQLGKLLPPRLAQHLETYAVLPVLYVSVGGW